MSTIKEIPADQISATFDSTCIDLVSAPLGSRIIARSDDFFAAAENLLTPGPPIHRPGHYVHTGAWFDGWETRRHNPAEYDYVVVRLGAAAGRIRGFEVDTAHFNGNHAPEVAIQAAFAPDASDDKVPSDWTTLLPRSPCGPSQRHAWDLGAPTTQAYTHIRLLMYPDGGIARFRVYGTVAPVLPVDTAAQFDLASVGMGGRAVSCSDQHFGRASNILLPGRGKDMGDGWETKRSRGAHVDWVVVRLGVPGVIDRVVVDTAHFRGNFPREVAVYATAWDETHGAAGPPGAADADAKEDIWTQIVAPQRTSADIEHEYAAGVIANVEGRTYTHVKLVIIPDGGVKRLRVFGRRAAV